MTRFNDRLADVLEWYRKKCDLEENRFKLLAEQVALAESQIEFHRTQVLAHQMNLIKSSELQAFELAALGSFCRQAKKSESRLRQDCQMKQKSLEEQRKVVLAAQRRLRLVEKLRDRRLEEHRYEETRKLEELASESYLAGFARGLNDPTE